MPVCIKASTLSARSFLQAYDSNDEESVLEDPITMLNQNELFLESKDGLDNWCITNISDLLIEIPCICRTLTIKMDHGSNRHLKLSSSVWFGRVVELPTIIKVVNSADFLIKFKNKSMGKECINAAMLLTNRPRCNFLNSGAGKHLSTFLLTGREGMFCIDADLAAWAMVVVRGKVPSSNPLLLMGIREKKEEDRCRGIGSDVEGGQESKIMKKWDGLALLVQWRRGSGCFLRSSESGGWQPMKEKVSNVRTTEAWRRNSKRRESSRELRVAQKGWEMVELRERCDAKDNWKRSNGMAQRGERTQENSAKQPGG